jgi:hypothetical protein
LEAALARNLDKDREATEDLAVADHILEAE